MSYPSPYQPPNGPPYRPPQYPPQYPANYPHEPVPPPYPAEIYDPEPQPQQLVIVDARPRRFHAPSNNFWSAWALVGWLTAFSIVVSMILSVAYFVWLTQQFEEAKQQAEEDKREAIRMIDRAFEKFSPP